MSRAHLIYVDPEPGIVAKRHLVLLGPQEPGRKDLGQCVQGPSKDGAAAGLIRVGPEQGDKGRPTVAPLLHGQKGQERECLSGLDFRRLAVSLNGRRSEETNLDWLCSPDFFHGVTASSHSRNGWRGL